MRILILDEEFPYPPNSGKRIRSFNLLKRLAVNHELYYIAYGSEDSESFRVFKELRMHPIAVPRRVPPKSGLAFYVRLLANLLSRYPYIVSSHYSSIFQSALDKTLQEKRPDLIICEWTPYAIFVKDISGVKKLIVAHNVESQIWKRYYDNEKQFIKKWYIGKQLRKLEQFERAAFRWVDGATVVSGADADVLCSFNHQLPVRVVENGVDLEYFQADNSKSNGDRLVFVGTMDWRPNQDAAVYFVNEILPLIRNKRPDVETVFVGRNPPSHIVALKKTSGITVTGSVDDVRPYIEESTVYIVPLRIGGGTRLKILDALAMKKAVVSTSIGAEGLDVTDGHDIMLADTPEQFADHVELLLDNSELNRRLGESGRRLVEKRYSWDGLAHDLERFIAELVEGK